MFFQPTSKNLLVQNFIKNFKWLEAWSYFPEDFLNFFKQIDLTHSMLAWYLYKISSFYFQSHRVTGFYINAAVIHAKQTICYLNHPVYLMGKQCCCLNVVSQVILGWENSSDGIFQQWRSPVLSFYKGTNNSILCAYWLTGFFINALFGPLQALSLLKVNTITL